MVAFIVHGALICIARIIALVLCCVAGAMERISTGKMMEHLPRAEASRVNVPGESNVYRIISLHNKQGGAGLQTRRVRIKEKTKSSGGRIRIILLCHLVTEIASDTSAYHLVSNAAQEGCALNKHVFLHYY